MILADQDFFQDVQDVYSELTDLTMVITDSIGEMITQLTGNKNLLDLVYEYKSINEALCQRVKNFSKITGPVLYDALPGVKVVVCPVAVNNTNTYFIFAGMIIKKTEKNSVISYLKQELNAPVEILAEIPESSDEEIQAKIDKLKKMAEILSKQLASQKAESERARKETSIASFLRLIEAGNADISTFLKTFSDSNQEVDLVGFARKTEADQLVIEEIIQSKKSSLKGSTFSTGEGLLGQVAATNKKRYWEKVYRDPRISYFSQKGIVPKSLAAVPILQGGQQCGLLFWGSSENEQLSQPTNTDGSIAASFLSIMESTLALRSKASNNLMKLTTLNEIFQVMAAVQDEKRILLILLDMSMNLIRGPFVSVILRQPLKNSLEIVSRGLTSEQIDSYSKDVSSRFSTNEEDKPSTHVTGWGAAVYEIPLRYQNHSYGYLSIGCNGTDIDEEDLSFLNSLSFAGGISIHLIRSMKEESKQSSAAGVLVELVELIEPGHSPLAAKASKLIESFCESTSIPVSNRADLKDSCYLIAYPVTLLKKNIGKPSILSLIEEYHSIEENKPSIPTASIQAQLLHLVWTYIKQGEQIENLMQITAVNHSLLTEFISFLNHTNVVVKEIQLADPVSRQPEISNDLNLSKRESEVMKLVVKGLNNRDIASHLYISEHTVKNHMTNIFQKMNVTDRSQAIAKIYQSGWDFIKGQ